MKRGSMKRGSGRKKPTRLRYTPEAAYARGAETRRRLIAAAIRLFGERGYERASTRDIAAAAALNTPALQYYFDNKEGLYAACAEHLADQAWELRKRVVTDAERLLAQSAGPDELIEAFCAVQDGMADFLESPIGDWLLWIAREQAGLGPASTYLLNQRKSARMLQIGRSLLARLLRRPAREAVTVLYEMALNAHLLSFYLLHSNTMRTLRWRRIDAERLQLVKRVTRQHTEASLHAVAAMRTARRFAGGRLLLGGMAPPG